jgi:hypothetical protein
MSEDNDQKKEGSIEGTINAATGLVKAVPIYQDAVQPAAKEVGKTLEVLAKTVNMAIAPLSAMVWGYDQIRDFVDQRVTEKLSNTPEEEIISPEPHIVGPALESLKYSGSVEELRELYANLIASSMDSKTQETSHPSFVEIIKQLSIKDAKILGHFSSADGEPIIRIRNEREDGKGGRDGLRNFSLVGEKTGCDNPEDCASSLDNLQRLGLVNIPADYKLVTEGVYDPLEEHSFIKSIIEKINAKDERKAKIHYSAILVTDLGRQFINSCVVDHRVVRNNTP